MFDLPFGRYCSLFARCVVLCTSSIVLIGSPGTHAQASPNPPKRVLLLYSFDNEEGIYTRFDHVLRSELRSDLRDRVEFYTEYLDLVRFPGPEHAANLVKLLKLEFEEHKPDLIVTVSYSALQFLLNEGKELFPGTPDVALFNSRRLEELKQRIASGSIGRAVTGVASTDEPARTLDLALRLQPDTQRVLVVVGSSQLEKYWVDQLKQDFLPYSGRIKVTYSAGSSMDEVLRNVAELPAHTVILNTFFFEDAREQFFLEEEALDLIAGAAHVPVYGIYSNDIGHGVVGGRMTDPENVGRQIAKAAARVLGGENAAAIPIALDNSAHDTVDWRQLQRWHLSEKRLPASTMELFREPSIWERYRYLIVGTVTLCLLETLLIVALLLSMQRRKRAESALRHEKALADAVIESLPGVFLLQDQAGRNLRWNRNAERISRYAPADSAVLGNIANPYKDAAQRAKDEVFDRGSSQLEAEMLVQGGGTAPYYFTGVRVELEGKPYLAAVGIDLTQRKQAEEAVRRSEAELRSFVENAPYGIGTISVRQDRFLHANPALVKLLGYKSQSEVLALTVSRDLYSDGVDATFRSQPTRADFFSAVEFRWKRKDGKPVVVRASGRRLSSPESGGDILEIIAEDVTAQRLLEEQLRHAQKMEALGQLAGSIAHDFNNLLGVIIGYSELLSADLGAEGQVGSRVDTIKTAGIRAASLTSQLLAFSRRQMLQPKVLNLNSLVSETDKMLQRLMGEDIEQRVVLDPALGRTKADPGQIVQVIINLAVNARDAMAGGGKLTITTSNVTLDEAANFYGVPVPPGQYVMLSVSDTGVGMDAETQKRLFEPFFTTKAAGKGTGLGLATVYGIVKQSGGYVFADSVLHKGTTFRVYLPRVDQPIEEASPQPKEMPGSPPESLTILVVEDERAFQELLRDGLQSKGYYVLVASNGVEALQVAEQHAGPIRLLITDVIMPQMSGPELAKCLTKARGDIDVLYMSGYTDDKLGTVASSSDELTWIQKPFYLQELLVRMQEIFNRNGRRSNCTRSAPEPSPRAGSK
jgi:two-component system cell cycle sensor histidine kinase/response regulator CckA